MRRCLLRLSSAGAVPRSADTIKLSDVKAVEFYEHKELRREEFIHSPRLVFTSKSKGCTVEVIPLYHMCVSPWYVQMVLRRISTSEHFSTVYLGSPYVSVAESEAPPAKRSYSRKLALELSFTNDFPKIIPIANPSRAPTFCQLHTKEQFLDMMLRGNPGGLTPLLTALNTSAAHDKDSICILVPRRGIETILKELTTDRGWNLETHSMAISIQSHRNYGLFINFMARFAEVLAVLVLLWNLDVLLAHYRTVQNALEADGKEKLLPIEDIRYFSSGYKPEQDIAVAKLRERLLAAPPGSGEDTREHNNFFSRAFTWENIAYPKPNLSYQMMKKELEQRKAEQQSAEQLAQRNEEKQKTAEES